MTEETKVEVNEQEVVSDEKPLNNYENPIIINAFKTPAIMAIPFKDDVKYLRDFAVSLPVIDPEANLIQSKNDHVLDLEEFKELKEFCDKCIKHYIKIECGSNHPVEITQSWINILKRYYGHPEHKHSNSYLSGVFYLDVPSEGGSPITFKRLDDPFSFQLGDEGDDFPGNHFPAVHNVYTAPSHNGYLLLFPSTMYHSVNINNLRSARMSLSFNTYPKRPFGTKEHFGYVR